MTLLPLNASNSEKAVDAIAAAKLAINLAAVDINPLTCHVELLGWLAYQWRVNIDNLAEQQQRNLITNAWEIHLYKGTVYSLTKALNSMDYQHVEIIERSIDATLQPYQFDVILHTVNPINAVEIAHIRKKINLFKNARSRLRTLKFRELIYDGSINYDGVHNYNGGVI